MIKTRLVGLLSHAKKYVIYTIFWQWIGLISQIVAVFTIANILEKVLYQELTKGTTIQPLIILISVIIIRFIAEKESTNASFLASSDVKRILREKIFEKMLRLGASYKEIIPTSEVVQVSSEGVEQLEVYFGKYLPQLFYSLIAPITLFIILSRLSLKASVVLLLCVPLIPLSIVVVQKIAKKLLNKYWSIYTGLGDSFLENLQGLTTLKVYQADAQKAVEMDEESQKFRKITMKVLTMQLNSTSVMDIVAYGGSAIGMVIALSEFLNGHLSLSYTLCIVLLASEFFLPLRLLGSYFHIAMNGMAASDKIFKILDLEEPKRKEKILDPKKMDITFSNVNFAYEKDRTILKNLNLKIPTKTMVSLVGESGSGKSTIAALLVGKNKGYSGDLCIGDIALKDINETDLLKNVCLVSYNSYLFKGSVEDNLLMAKPNASQKELEETLEKVNLLGFLKTQDGLKTKLEEKGNNLSGGQRQRLVIARALLLDAKVYIFDEATSNIDSESEENIMNVIHSLSKTKTVILISHRLSNVVDSDMIYYLENGEIKESGTHDELMIKQGAYKHLFDSQISLENFKKGDN